MNPGDNYTIIRTIRTLSNDSRHVRRTVSTIPPARSLFHFINRNLKTAFTGGNDDMSTVHHSPERSQDVE